MKFKKTLKALSAIFVLLALLATEAFGGQGVFGQRLFQKRRHINENNTTFNVNDPQKDLDFLINGVKKIASPGTPGYLSVFGSDALILAYGMAGENLPQPGVAAGRFGKGKMVAFGHAAFLANIQINNEFDTARLITNSIHWLSSSGSTSRVLHLGNDDGEKALNHLGFHVEKADLENLDPARVLVVQEGYLHPKYSEKVSLFVKNGGGFMTSTTGWGWLQFNPGKDLRKDHGANLVLEKGGIVFGNGYLSPVMGLGLSSNTELMPKYHVKRALEIVDSVVKGKKEFQNELEAKLIYNILQIAANNIPSGNQAFAPKIKEILDNSPEAFFEKYPDFRVLKANLLK